MFTFGAPSLMRAADCGYNALPGMRSGHLANVMHQESQNARSTAAASPDAKVSQTLFFGSDFDSMGGLIWGRIDESLGLEELC